MYRQPFSKKSIYDMHTHVKVTTQQSRQQVVDVIFRPVSIQKSKKLTFTIVYGEWVILRLSVSF